MRDRARVVVIGGGVGGCAILYWLTQARLGRRPARRAGRPHERLDLPLGRPGRPAARLAQPHEDDDELGRALPDARRGGRARDRLARGRVAPARLVGGAHGGDRAPGGLGQDVRPPAGADLGRGGAAALPADVHRRSARRGLPADRRLHRPEPADLRARRGRPARRRRARRRTRASPGSSSSETAFEPSRPTRAGSRPRPSSTPAACSPPSWAHSPASSFPSSRWRTST